MKWLFKNMKSHKIETGRWTTSGNHAFWKLSCWWNSCPFPGCWHKVPRGEERVLNIFYTDHHCFCKISSILRRISHSQVACIVWCWVLKNWNRSQPRVKSPGTWWKPTGISVSFITCKGILCMSTLFCDSGPNSCCACHQMSIGISLFVYV